MLIHASCGLGQENTRVLGNQSLFDGQINSVFGIVLNGVIYALCNQLVKQE